MALQVQVYKLSPKNAAIGAVVHTQHAVNLCTKQQNHHHHHHQSVVSVAVNNGGGRRLSLRVKSSLDASATASTTPPTVVVGQVTEVDKDTFWPIVNAAADKTVVLDMYTQWCGPCKVIAPKYQELSKKYLDVVFLKLDCNQDNKPLAKELGIRVVPTFKILKDSKIVKEVTGAKFDDLVAAIESARSA